MNAEASGIIRWYKWMVCECVNVADASSALSSQAHWLQLLLTLFVTGITGSFSHCVWMCGPIAISQMSMRLMGVKSSEMSEMQKVKSAAATPYYIGKALTYALLATLASLISSQFRTYYFFQIIGTTLLCIVAIFFLKAGFNSLFSIASTMLSSLKIVESTARLSDIEKTIKFLETKCMNKISLLNLNPYNVQGLILGMILGLIPCGLVYANVALIVSATEDVWLTALAMFVFGIATIPGLFLVAYLGSNIFEKYKKIFSIFHTCTMFFNAYLLIIYVSKIL